MSKKLITIRLNDGKVIKRPINLLSSVKLSTDRNINMKSDEELEQIVEFKVGDNVSWKDKSGEILV